MSCLYPAPILLALGAGHELVEAPLAAREHGAAGADVAAVARALQYCEGIVSEAASADKLPGSFYCCQYSGIGETSETYYRAHLPLRQLTDDSLFKFSAGQRRLPDYFAGGVPRIPLLGLLIKKYYYFLQNMLFNIHVSKLCNLCRMSSQRHKHYSWQLYEINLRHFGKSC